jgi:hypothetical protein
MRRWRIGFFAAIGFAAAGLAAIGFAGAAGAAAGGFAPAGAAAGGAFCAKTGAAIARAAAMATPVRRCFMLVVLCGSSGFDTTATADIPHGDPCGSSVETTHLLFRSDKYATVFSAYPTSPVPDNIYRR